MYARQILNVRRAIFSQKIIACTWRTRKFVYPTPHKWRQGKAIGFVTLQHVQRGGTAQLGKVIREGEHNSTEDAKATMELYHLVKDEWEDDVCMGKYVQLLLQA